MVCLPYAGNFMTWITLHLARESFASQPDSKPASLSQAHDAGHHQLSEGLFSQFQRHHTNRACYKLGVMSPEFHRNEIAYLWLMCNLITSNKRLDGWLCIILLKFCFRGDAGLGISMMSFSASCALLLLNGNTSLDRWLASWYIDGWEQKTKLLQSSQ